MIILTAASCRPFHAAAFVMWIFYWKHYKNTRSTVEQKNYRKTSMIGIFCEYMHR